MTADCCKQYCCIFFFFLKNLTSVKIYKDKCTGTKHTSTASKYRQITSPGSVFF